MRVATYLKRYWGGAVVLLILVEAMACNVLDREHPTGVTAPTMTGESTDLSNFIIGDPEVTTWGGQYVKDNTYFMLNIPISDAVKVEYCVKGGGCFAVFVETATPTKWEIGLTTVDGVTAVLERVCVTYEEHGVFASVPTNVEKATQHKATHYQRKLDNGNLENWWPIDAAFVFDGETKTICVVTNSMVQETEVSGPFQKPTPELPTNQQPIYPICNPQTFTVPIGGDFPSLTIDFGIAHANENAYYYQVCSGGGDCSSNNGDDTLPLDANGIYFQEAYLYDGPRPCYIVITIGLAADNLGGGVWRPGATTCQIKATIQ